MNVSVNRVLTCDVLVLGGGGAGIRAALTAADIGSDVLLISETPLGESGSTFYPLSFEWGMLSATDAQDAEDFTNEILAAAKGCINPKLADYLAKGSKEAHDRFLSEGLPLTPMKEMNITGCFGKEPRGDFLRDMNSFIASQQQLIRSHPKIRFYRLTVCSLLTCGKRCIGAMAVDEAGALIQLSAKAVVMALGGGEGLYRHRAAFGPLYGGAYAMAARHGARIVNLEFIQFVPGSVAPIAFVNYFPFLLNEHPYITNLRDEACMSRYLPEGLTADECLDAHAKHGPFSCEDYGKYLEYAMVGEEAAGNGMGIKLWPRISGPRDRRGEHWREFLHRLNMDENTVMQLYPMCQGFNGGILLRDDLTTDLEGLFACGESSGGLHGPDRMGGLCILATQVFGAGAGQRAGKFATMHETVLLSRNDAKHQFENEFFTQQPETVKPMEALEKIRNSMQENACLRRNEYGLTFALETLQRLCLQPLAHIGTPECASYFRVTNALDASRLILTAMRNRRESRGSHDRSDYSAHDPTLERMQWVSMHHGQIIHGRV